MKVGLVFFALIGLAPAAPVQAQDAPKTIAVVFDVRDDDWRDQRLMQLIRQALSRTPGFNLMAKITPDALVITVPGGLGQHGHEEDARYDFTAMFFRNGDKIGESLEGCTPKTLDDCANQLAADAQSAAGMQNPAR